MFSITISQKNIMRWQRFTGKLTTEKFVVFLAAVLAAAATFYSLRHGYITAYGDAESHLNIAKRVIDSLTPGFAQLGGIWLPLPHLLLMPFVYVDFLWRTGLAGSIISGAAFVVSAIFLFKLTLLITKNRAAAFFASLVFTINPNILYMQTTPMTELTLIVFFILSSYYFIVFLQDDKNILPLVLSAAFGFCAALSRYDGWFLVLAEAGILSLLYLPWQSIPKSVTEIKNKFNKERWAKLEGRVIMFSTLAMFGIFIWLAWGMLILGDPLYFTHSQFSAKSQQHSWLIRGELPGYKNFWLSFVYYFVTSMSNVGVIVFALAIAGAIYLLFNKQGRHRYFVLLVLLVPFIFNVLTLYVGQSVIFIPHITPITFEWRLFNARYGIMMVPFAAVAAAYLFYKTRIAGKILISGLLVAQVCTYLVGYSPVITLEDGRVGLSSATAKIPDAQYWIDKNYDGGLVLVDDYARTMSIIRTHIPMKRIIYVGNKPYWDDSLKEPEKYATWIIMQKNDDVWNNIYENPEVQGRLFKYFQKVYTSPDVLIFKRIIN